jgi:hypothetical protein
MVTRPVLAAVLALSVLQQTAPPDTEIFLAGLSRTGNSWTLTGVENITRTPGYDNQPSFTPEGDAILFTSARGGDAAPGRAPQTDIYRYDLHAKATRRLTNTPESEYSPTVMPGGSHFSVVRVEADGTQRLWRFTREGTEPALILADVKPVGYHAWVDASTLALFVLGEPSTLQVADTRTGRAEIVARDIGRSIARIPGGGVGFVQRTRPAGAPPDAPPGLAIMELDVAGKTARELVAAVPGAREADTAWAQDATLLMTYEDAIFTWRRGETGWSKAVALAPLGIRGATRLAVSPRGDRLAIVAAGP